MLVSVLKAIGIIILVLIGLLVLGLIGALFVPVRYKIKVHAKPLESEMPQSLMQVAFDNDLQAKVQVSWLVHIVHASISFQKKGKEKADLLIKVRLFGINLFGIVQRKLAKKQAKKSHDKNNSQKEAAEESEKLMQAKHSELEHEFLEKEAVEQEVFNDDVLEELDAEELFAKEETEKLSFGQKVKRLFETIKKLFEKIKGIKYTIIDKVHQLDREIQKAKRVKKVLESKRAKVVFAKVKKELLRIWKRVKPSCKGELHIGTGAPDSMGEFLAVYGVLIGIMPMKLVIVPEFERPALDGNLQIRGKVALYWFLKAVWMYLFDKDIKRLVAMLEKATGQKKQKQSV